MKLVDLGVRLALAKIELAALEGGAVAGIGEAGADLGLGEAAELREKLNAALAHQRAQRSLWSAKK